MRKSVEGEEGCGSEGVRFGKGDIQGKGEGQGYYFQGQIKGRSKFIGLGQGQ